MGIESEGPLLLAQNIDCVVPGVECEIVCSPRRVVLDGQNMEELLSEWDGDNPVIYRFTDPHSDSKYRVFFKPEMLNRLKNLWQAAQ